MKRDAPTRPGDLVLIEGHRLGEPRRVGEILEVLGTSPREHFRVRWDDGHESIFYPSNDAVVQHHRDTKEEQVLVHEP